MAAVMLLVEQCWGQLYGGVFGPGEAPYVRERLRAVALDRLGKACRLEIIPLWTRVSQSVDRRWAIAKVSRFKKKFGGRPYTIIQGSLFRHPEKYRAAARGHVGRALPTAKRFVGMTPR